SHFGRAGSDSGTGSAEMAAGRSCSRSSVKLEPHPLDARSEWPGAGCFNVNSDSTKLGAQGRPTKTMTAIIITTSNVPKMSTFRVTPGVEPARASVVVSTTDGSELRRSAILLSSRNQLFARPTRRVQRCSGLELKARYLR